MDRLDFLVIGSQGDPYRVTFERSGENLNAFCTCPAGSNGQYCKHRFALINGEFSSVQSANVADLQKLKILIKGTDLEFAYQELVRAENLHAEAKKALDAAKKKMAKAMFR